MYGGGAQGQLIIKPSSGNLTYDSEWFGDMDLYARITVWSNVFKTQVAHDQGKHPVWQDQFTAMVNGDQTMHVCLFDRDNVSNDDYIAEAQINLMDVYQRRMVSNWFPLMRKGQSAGQIMITLEFYPGGGMGMGMNPGMGMGMNMGMNPGMGMGMGMNPGMGMGGYPPQGGMGMGMGGYPPQGGMGMGMGMGGYPPQGPMGPGYRGPGAW